MRKRATAGGGERGGEEEGGGGLDAGSVSPCRISSDRSPPRRFEIFLCRTTLAVAEVCAGRGRRPHQRRPVSPRSGFASPVERSRRRVAKLLHLASSESPTLRRRPSQKIMEFNWEFDKCTDAPWCRRSRTMRKYVRTCKQVRRYMYKSLYCLAEFMPGVSMVGTLLCCALVCAPW